VPAPEPDALAAAEVERWIELALNDAQESGIAGKDLTPFLLARIAAASGGRALRANVSLVNNNARVGAKIARALAQSWDSS
jgi:pseudouridine-5'-phosphate glycosidase